MTATATTRLLRGLPSLGKSLERPWSVRRMYTTWMKQAYFPTPPTSLKVLTDRGDTGTCRGASIQRVLVMAIECVLTDGCSPLPHDHIACCDPSEDLDHVCNSRMAS